MSEKRDTRFMGGENALEIIQEDLKEEIEQLVEDLVTKVMVIAKYREGYDLRSFALDCLKDSL